MRVNRVNKVLVFLAKLYEMKLAKWGDHHLCVSKAMQTDLVHKFGINPKTHLPHVLYDKATQKFGQISLEEMHQVLKRAKLVTQEE